MNIFDEQNSTSDAFMEILARLRNIQAVTGRPYVLLAYGDHQPWDFTDGVYSVAGEKGSGSLAAAIPWPRSNTNGPSVRTKADIRETFFHVAASDAG